MQNKAGCWSGEAETTNSLNSLFVQIRVNSRANSSSSSPFAGTPLPWHTDCFALSMTEILSARPIERKNRTLVNP
jgi:hypothetical protein